MSENTTNSELAAGAGLSRPPRPKAAHFPHSEITRLIIGALYEVHSELGGGFLERVYANALAIVLRAADLRVDREVPYEILFRGEVIGRYVADMVVDSTVVVEVKAAEHIERSHRAQLVNYLRASDLPVGLVLNFGASAQFKRMVNSTRRPRRAT
jgi:GxxExxY protein